MSTVGSSSDSSGSSSVAGRQDENARRREAAANEEAELVKKHAKEVRRLNEAHYAEVENLKHEHADQMADLHNLSSDEISKRDHKYQQEMEDLRGLYKRQLQAQADETARKEEALRTALQSDFKAEKTQSESHAKDVSQQYEKNLIQHENIYGEALKEAREAQKNALVNNKDAQTSQFEKEAKIVRDERAQKVATMDRAYNDYRQSSESRFRDQEVRNFQDSQRSSENLIRAVQKERVAAKDNEDLLRDGYEDAAAQTRESVQKAAAREREENEYSHDNLKSTVGERIDRDVNRLKVENAQLRDADTRQEVKSKVGQRRQLNDVRDAYQKNIDNYREQRDDALRVATDRTHKDIQKVRKELESEAVEQNRYYRSHEDEQNKIYKGAFENLKGDFEVRNEQTKATADSRVKNLYETTSEEKARLAELQVDGHTASQRTHQDEMKALRSAMEADKQIAVNTLQTRLERQESQHGERMAQVVSKYEKQIQAMKDQMVRDKKAADDNLKRSVDEMQRMHKVSLDQVASQSRDRLRQADQQHSEELRNLNKRNDQKLDQVLAEVKKS